MEGSNHAGCWWLLSCCCTSIVAVLDLHNGNATKRNAAEIITSPHCVESGAECRQKQKCWVSQSATNGRQSARDDLFAFTKRYFNYLEIVPGENNNGYVRKKAPTDRQIKYLFPSAKIFGGNSHDVVKNWHGRCEPILCKRHLL